MILELIPFKKVGEFTFGESITPIIEKYKYNFSPVDESGLKSFILKDIGISLYVENETIEYVACHQICIYNGRNLIQMNYDDFIIHVGFTSNSEKDEVYMTNGETQDVYEFDDIGLQVWVKDKTVVTVIAFPFIEEDE